MEVQVLSSAPNLSESAAYLYGDFRGQFSWIVSLYLQIGNTKRTWKPIFKDDTGTGDIHLHISRFAVIASTTVLEARGLFAGLLPAIKASRLDPIKALRYEALRYE